MSVSELLCLFVVIFISLLIIIAMFIKAKKLYRKAYYDDVTSLHNRVFFREEAQRILTKNKNQKYALIITNIAHFRTIYGCYGPSLGDFILRFFSEKLLAITPQNVLLARAKEDKFQILLPYKTRGEIIEYLELLAKEIHSFKSEDVPTKLYIRCGVGLLDGEIDDYFKMQSYVELARKEAIKRGTVYHFFDTEMADKLRREKDFSDIMETALENREFKVYYQAKYDTYTNKVIGAEALVRWDSVIRGFKKPDEFIPVFEKNGFIIELDFFVLEEVCKMLRQQLDSGATPVPISVNQSRVHLLKDNYCQRMRDMIKKYDLPAGLVELEITETVSIDMQKACNTMMELKTMGYNLSIDDFGNGYSSFPILFNVPIDTLKIDKDFISKPGNIKTREILLRMIVAMSHELNLTLVCEGVEKKEQVEFLQANGCKNVQGYLYARPVPQEDFLKGNFLKFS